MELIVGASIALVGSVIGGLVSPLILALIQDKRERAREEREDSRAIRQARIAAARETTDALLAVSQRPGDSEAQARILRATFDLELLLGENDDDVTTMVADAANSVHEQLAETRNLTAATLCLASWARGASTGLAAVAEYRRLTGRIVGPDQLIEG